MKTRRRHSEHHDEATEQAGWLFADSFLALMVIFLATISFVPDFKNIEAAPATWTKSLTLSYDSYDPAKVEEDILNFLIKEDLPVSSEVAFARIIGGVQEGEKQDSSNGYLLALKYSIDLQRDVSGYFNNTRFDITSSSLVPNRSVTIQVTINPKDPTDPTAP